MSNAVPIIFTTSAAQKARSLIQEEGDQELKLRVFISGGGCSGYQYGFTFDKNVNEGDTVIERKLKTHSDKNAKNDDEEDGGSGTVVQLLIDSGSIQYLANAEIDFRDSPGGGEFVIRNPNAKTTCGCGSSFST